MGNNHKHLQDECIRVQKVYDWVTDTLNVRKTVSFTPEQIAAIEEALDDPSKRPLRIVTKVPKTSQANENAEACAENFLCEQVGDKRECTVALNGGFTTAQLVELLFTTDIKVQVVDRSGEIVTELIVNASVFESFVLCYPDGTDLYCRITKIFARVPSGTVLLNSPAPTSFSIDITFCVDIQVEAEVKLEVLAKFCSPRENDLICEGSEGEMCPEASFPQQCPDIYPRPGCMCRATGSASGLTGDEATEAGRVAVLVDICPNYHLSGSSFRLSYTGTEDQGAFQYTATEFTQDSLCCDEYSDGWKMIISGRGTDDSTGENYNFNLAIVQTSEGNQFEAELINSKGDREFTTGVVTTDTGEITVGNCLQHS
ncbi:hypothetical protein [Fictibacillus arsenicus]|uniref:Uncharacterized protein n=1 Tax=Fictibacillus arsenicus TaxID=255247 RepID=A0A1V3G6T6_9BACL|nr:hypothetical protein [Fictibacillus arsenicus]OOE12118.1 hypothetical protein UN64_08345 [Fictibacillus arsenicus]